MIQPKSLVAAFAFVGLLTTSGIANSESVSSFYVEVGVSHTTDVDDVTADFSQQNTNATWGISEMIGAKFQIGGDFGYFRTDLKLRAMYAGQGLGFGGVETISGGVNNVGNSRAILGVGTLNGYVDIYDIKVGDDAFITPYVGIGGGYARGYMEASGDLNGDNLKDHNNTGGLAIVYTGGALFSVNEHFGVSAEYERIDTDVGGFDAHTASLGLRVTF